MNVNISNQEIRDMLIDVIRQEFKSGVESSMSASLANTLAELQSELEKTKQLLDEKTTELDQLKESLQVESLENIDSKNSKTSAELIDATKIQSNTTNADTAKESSSFRTLLEEVMLEMKNVKTELRWVRDAGSCTTNNYADNSPGVRQIRTQTHEEEVLLTTEEYEKSLETLEAPVDGDSLGGMSVPEISANIPLNKGNQVTLTIEISEDSYSGLVSMPEFCVLQNGTIYNHSGEAYKDVPAVIKEGTREVAMFRGGVPTPNNVPGGAIAYRIGLTGLQLLIYYFNNKLKRSVMGFGLTLAELPVKTYFDNSSLGCSSQDLMRPDKKYLSVESETTTTLVKLHNLRAKATIIPSTRAIWTIEILSLQLKNSPNAHLKFDVENHLREVKCLKPGLSLVGKSIPNLLANISTVYGCIVEISNGLKVSLENPTKHFFDGELPQLILPDIREVLIITNNTKLEGVLTYQIEGTDLRLAFAIRCEDSGNSFAIGFIPAHANTNQHLMSSLMDSSHWKTRPDKKYALAHEGPQMIEIRNIFALAAMASEPKALLKISVTTF